MTLQIKNLAKRYAEVAVFQNVTLSVAPGEFVAIVGESGVGKSTLLNCMAGLDSWDDGSVTLKGVDLGSLPDDQRALLRREHVGFVFQAFHVLPHLDVSQNVALPLLLLGQHDAERVEAMLQAVGLAGLGKRLPQQLSGGQLQRVMFARLLLQDAELILLDEPFTAIDSRTAGELLQIIKRWHGEGRTILAVLHDMETVRQHFPDTLLLAREKVAHGPTAKVLTAENLFRARQMCEAFDDTAPMCKRGVA